VNQVWGEFDRDSVASNTQSPAYQTLALEFEVDITDSVIAAMCSALA
jgi:hypothetical protein